ncbi:peptidoglycan DD-metalloendopeptidase family protein [Paenibacillus sp. GSMTC-2017]|uniref:murein hydrolase activator EnvC family protein n=1 Tax=Paenibacillus sp. GSMTC-2017 TaxID=2794350 RepID=UPI0018D5DDBD|nr:M23 family metallopeptidase [Paenibacillus sp. GSMTC-2017]MBH5320651.1 peptidoglycan DD-metalloendopeptidase family protein [Paenibacillus sp. GSMTC-2017]
MKKICSMIMMVALLAVFVFQPVGSEASSLSQIERDLAAAKKEMRESERKQANAEKEARSAEKKKDEISTKKEDIQQELTKLMDDLSSLSEKKAKKQAEKDAKHEEIIQTGIELDKAEKRVVERDELLKSRMRLMYTNGFVSYMDVLLSASSFTDFLDRFDALQTILNADREVLAAHKKDKELVIQKKKQTEKQFAELETLYEELVLQQKELVKKESEKEVLIASYNANIKELDTQITILSDISEEQEAALMALAAKVSKLNAEKKRIKNPFTGGTLGMPIDSKYGVTSSFGTRIHPIYKKKHTHTGIDFGAPSGTAIYAAEAGYVNVSQLMSGYGNAIIIDHGNGLWTLYAHIRHGGLLVSEGETVKKGQKIAEVGMTGTATGPHLHFEVRKNQVPVNPSGYLKKK